MTPTSEGPYALLVDDDQSILTALTMLLTSFGWKTTKAATAEEALKEAAEKPFRVAIIDFNMPKVNGLELCRMIRDQNKNENLVIFIHSGYMAPHHANKIESSGANAVIWKPAGLAEIREAFVKYGLLDK